jgi:hypothetical protein
VAVVAVVAVVAFPEMSMAYVPVSLAESIVPVRDAAGRAVSDAPDPENVVAVTVPVTPTPAANVPKP